MYVACESDGSNDFTVPFGEPWMLVRVRRVIESEIINTTTGIVLAPSKIFLVDILWKNHFGFAMVCEGTVAPWK